MQAFRLVSLFSLVGGCAICGRSIPLRESLLLPLVPGGGVGTQPQRDVLRLHRFPNHSHQIVAQGIDFRLVPKLR
jgi:hypothetical protein